MAKQKTKEQMAFDVLPEAVQDILMSSDTLHAIQAIGKDNGLSIEQTREMGYLITLATTSIIQKNQLTQELINRLKIDSTRAQSIEQILDARIFDQIKKAGKNFDNNKLNSIPPPIATVQGVQMQKESLTPETQDSIIVASANVEKEEGNVQTGIVEDVASLNKETLLKEIESPALITAHASTPEYEPTIIDKKLSGIMKVPREEVRVNVDANTPSYKGTDPYREPLE